MGRLSPERVVWALFKKTDGQWELVEITTDIDKVDLFERDMSIEVDKDPAKDWHTSVLERS